MALIANILSKFDNSGVRKAEKSFGSLKGSIAAIGVGLGLEKIGEVLLESAKAASIDEKSMKMLDTQLGRNAHANKAQIAQSDKFIEQLSLQTGIIKNKLRPTYARFANVTHNVKDAQKLLGLTLDATAGSGLSQAKIAKAVAKAYDGNTKSLQSMFPELKNSKTALADLATEYKGMAVANADPFAKFNNSMDILKEKLGAVILPLLSDFVDYLSKPGGIIDQVGTFLDTMKDPKSEAGKAITNIRNAANNAFNFVKTLFDLFKNPYIQALAVSVLAFVAAFKLFTAIAPVVEVALGILSGELIILDGALTAMGWTLIVAAIIAIIAGITWLATQTTFFQDIWTVMVSTFMGTIKMIEDAWGIVSTAFTTAFDFIGKMFKGYVNFWIGLFEGFINGILNGINGMLGGLNLVLDGIKTATGGAVSLHVNAIPNLKLPRLAKGGIVMPSSGGTNVTVGEGGSPEAIVPLNGKNGFGNTINIHVYSADPKSVVDAVSQYVKVNGRVPVSWNTSKAR